MEATVYPLVHKVKHGEFGSFSSGVVCVNLVYDPE